MNENLWRDQAIHPGEHSYDKWLKDNAEFIQEHGICPEVVGRMAWEHLHHEMSERYNGLWQKYLELLMNQSASQPLHA